MLRKKEDSLTWDVWCNLWKSTGNDNIRMGLLHSVMSVISDRSHRFPFRPQMTDIDPQRFRLLLLIADVHSGYSMGVRSKAYSVIILNNKVNGRFDWRSGNTLYRRSLLWYLRPDKSEIWPVNSEIPMTLHREDRGESLFEKIFGEMPISWHERPYIHAIRRQLFMTMTSLSPKETASLLRRWLFEHPSSFQNAVSSEINFQRLYERMKGLDHEVTAVLHRNVTLRYKSFKDALLMGDELAHFIHVIGEIRDDVSVGYRRTQLEKELAHLNG